MQRPMLWFYGVFFYFYMGSSPAQAQPIPVLFVGDSLTEGFGIQPEASFPSVVAKILKQDETTIEAINAGVAGATSASGLRRFHWHMKRKNKPRVVILALGANDGLRGIKVPAMQANLEKVILEAKKKGLAVILAGMRVPPNYGPEYTKAFDAVYPALAKKHDVVLIPFLLDGVAANRALNLPDGIHPNQEGYKVVAQTVAKYLKPILKSLKAKDQP